VDEHTAVRADDGVEDGARARRQVGRVGNGERDGEGAAV
jgi:hypothetical protein